LRDVVYVGRPVFADPNSEVMVFKIDSERAYATRVRVRFGRSSVSTIEVLGGLQVGDVIILSDKSSYEQYDRVSLK
jgi:HlyD family secretion protein